MAEDPRETPREVFEALLDAWMDACDAIEHADPVPPRERAEWLARYDAAMVAAVLPIEPPADEGDLEELHARMLRAAGVPEASWPDDLEGGLWAPPLPPMR